ncbi:Nitrilase [Pseudocyphellaria aurata]|nr:Nitrilase [Pseudocyphellaria aurata]
MPQCLTVAVSQSCTLSTTSATLSALASTTQQAAHRGTHLLLFPGAYLGGYPRTCTFGSSVGSRSDIGREQFLRHFHDAVDLGDTPAGAGDEWVERRLEIAKGQDFRGDGTREALEKLARETGVFLVVGLVERAGGSLYCAAVYVCPREGCIGKRRKVMPTGSERLIWAQGSPSTLRAVTTTIEGVKLTLASAICWENYMPLLRFSLYSQNVNLYLAPTADARDTWLPLMQTIACEGRTFVLSANQCVKRKHLPAWIKDDTISKDWRADKCHSNKSPQRQLRRSSTITKTDDNHEITWPLPEPEPIGANGSKFSSEVVQNDNPSSIAQVTPKVSRRMSVVTKIEDNHEITWPSLETTSQNNLPPIQHSDDKASPTLLPLTTIPTDDVDEGDLNSPSSFHRLAKTPSNHLIALPSSNPPSQSTPKESSTLSAINSDSSAGEEFICRGGSCIISPTGAVLAGPLWEVETGGLLFATVDFEDCERGRLDLDVAGSYGRGDAFELRVRGLDISPPS